MYNSFYRSVTNIFNVPSFALKFMVSTYPVFVFVTIKSISCSIVYIFLASKSFSSCLPMIQISSFIANFFLSNASYVPVSYNNYNNDNIQYHSKVSWHSKLETPSSHLKARTLQVSRCEDRVSSFNDRGSRIQEATMRDKSVDTLP